METPERLLGGLAARDMVQPLGSEWAFKHMLIRDVAYESLVRTDKARLHLALARWLDEGGHGDRQVIATHYAVAAGLGLSEARSRRRAPAAGRGVRRPPGGRARPRAAPGRAGAGAGRRRPERCASYEAVGDAFWMAEQIEKAFEAYDRALEHGVSAGLPPADWPACAGSGRDAPTRWSASRAMAATRQRIEDEIARGLDDATAAGDEAMEARLLTAGALFTWRVETAAEPQELALTRWPTGRWRSPSGWAGRARPRRPATRARCCSTRSTATTRRLENDEARFALLPKIRWREEQMDVCAASARTRQAIGDFAGSVEAVKKAEQLAQRDDPRWLSLPARLLVETYFLWDRWDDALESYDRFLDVFRRTAAARRQAMIGGVASGAVAGVHILRGNQERPSGSSSGWARRRATASTPPSATRCWARASRRWRSTVSRDQGQPLAGIGDRGGGAAPCSATWTGSTGC